MDIINSFRTYVELLLSEVDGMKVLVLDDETSKMISLVYSQTELFNNDVILIENIHNLIKKPQSNDLQILTSVFLVRPCGNSMNDVLSELNSPHFSGYHIFFTNNISADDISNLAYSDKKNRVSTLHVIYLDVYSLNKRLFSLNIPGAIKAMSLDNSHNINKRISEGIFSVLSSMNLRPILRYDSVSSISRNVAEFFCEYYKVNKDRLSYSKDNIEDCTVLFLDRRVDPLTPLLHGWTYQEMINDYLQFENNIITLGNEQFVVDERSDSFFKNNLYSDYGTLGQNISNLTKSVQSKKFDTTQINDIETLKSYIQNYPSYQEKSQLASKHITITSAFADKVNKYSVLDVSELEQSICCDNNPNEQLESMRKYFGVGNEISLRLVLIYALKYRDSDRLNNISPEFQNHIQQMLNFVPFKKLQENALLMVASSLKNMFTGSENSRMRRKTHLEEVLTKFKDGKLDEKSFPYIIIDGVGQKNTRKVIAFIVGGVTYAEGAAVYRLQKSAGIDAVVGGTSVLNWHSFLRQEVNMSF